MKFLDLLKQLDKLNLPKDKYAIFGSGVLAIRNLRDTNDLDIIVKDDLFEELSLKYSIIDNKKIIVGDVEIFKDWKPWFDDVFKLINDSEIINNYPFVKLKYLLKWKKQVYRQKDLDDIKIIEDYLKNNNF
jgi:hypothetical protein